MTTSYELSLRLKEAGAVQNGEYYWTTAYHWPDLYIVHAKQLKYDYAIRSILCRAFTLGELVRELPYYTEIAKLDGGFVAKNGFDNATNQSPEEAAGELYCEILKQKA